MGRINITPSDLKRNKIVKPGWYNVEFTGNKVETNKAGDASNDVIDMVIIDDGPFKDVPLRSWISEKAQSILGTPLYKALGGKVNEDEGIDFEITEDSLKGKRVRAKVETSEYNGRPTNQVIDFAPPA